MNKDTHPSIFELVSTKFGP